MTESFRTTHILVAIPVVLTIAWTVWLFFC